MKEAAGAEKVPARHVKRQQQDGRLAGSNAQDDPAYQAAIAPLLDKEKQLEDRAKQLEDNLKMYADRLDAPAAIPRGKGDRPKAHRRE